MMSPFFLPQLPVYNDAEHDELRETVSLNLINPIKEATTVIYKQNYSVTASMKRSKQTNPGSNDKQIKPYKRFKSAVASHDPSPSNGDPIHSSKEDSNPPVSQTIDKTKKLLRGKRKVS